MLGVIGDILGFNKKDECSEGGNNRIVIVPDVHGRLFWRKVLDNRDDRIVFLGDYSDPYSREGFTHDDALHELSDIIRFKKENMERVTLLLGNHCMSYIEERFRCCRFSEEHYEAYHALYIENRDLFQVAFEYEQNEQKYLFTHAGVSKGWLEYNKDELVEGEGDSVAELLNRTFAVKPEIWSQVSIWRGGRDDYGSPIWADLDEHDELGAFPEVIQIFGHSQLQDYPYINENMWDVDCRKVFVLQNGRLREYAT